MRSGNSIFFLLIILFFSTSFNFRLKNNEPLLSEKQTEVISYFKEVALGFEYGNASGITRKWKTPMKIYVMGEATPVLMDELHRVADELNALFTDGFHIGFTDKKDESNFVMYFGSRGEFSKLYPADAKTVTTSSGLFHIYWNDKNQIVRGYIFIHTHKTSEQEQRHTIREELTQALGLGKDSPRYKESIFQSSWTIPTEFADIDRELIRLLYHPDLIEGADELLTEDILKEILIKEQISLN